MKRFSRIIIVAAMILPMLLIGCSDDPETPKTYKEVDTEGKTILCLGNSLTVGLGTENPNREAYPVILAEKVNIPVVISGVSFSGITAIEAAEDVTSGNYDDEFSNAAVIIIELGANDLIDRYNILMDGGSVDLEFVDEVEESFREILDHIDGLNTDKQIFLAKFYNRQMAENMLVGDGYNYMSVYNDYEAMFSRLASDYGAELIGNIFDGVYGNEDLMYHDGIHPSAAGYKIMANNYFNSMKGFFDKNGLVK